MHSLPACWEFACEPYNPPEKRRSVVAFPCVLGVSPCVAPGAGMIGEIYVVSPEDEPFMAAALRANVRVTAIGAAVAAILALLVA